MAGSRLDGAYWVTGMQRPPAEIGADRLGAADGDARELAAERARGREQRAPRLPRSRRWRPGGRPASAPAQQRSTRPGVAQPAADEDRVGRGQARPARPAPRHRRLRAAGTPSAAAFSSIMAQRAASRSIAMARMRAVGAQPFDGDRAAAGADVPQQLARRAAPARPSVAARTSRLVSWPSWRRRRRAGRRTRGTRDGVAGRRCIRPRWC